MNTGPILCRHIYIQTDFLFHEGRKNKKHFVRVQAFIKYLRNFYQISHSLQYENLYCSANYKFVSVGYT